MIVDIARRERRPWNVDRARVRSALDWAIEEADAISEAEALSAPDPQRRALVDPIHGGLRFARVTQEEADFVAAAWKEMNEDIHAPFIMYPCGYLVQRLRVYIDNYPSLLPEQRSPPPPPLTHFERLGLALPPNV